MKIAEFSVRNPVYLHHVLALSWPWVSAPLLNMPRAEDPKFAPPGYNIVMVYPGAGPAEMENKITDKVEARLHALENIDRMPSLFGSTA
jgi:HAE1 family hydrophobic/amphiphilic exporter-1